MKTKKCDLVLSASGADFGSDFPILRTKCVLAPRPRHGCDSIPRTQESDCFFILDRGGGCSFSEKSLNAFNAGGMGVIIVNVMDESNLFRMGHAGPGQPSPIPTFMVSKRDGDRLRKCLRMQDDIEMNVKRSYLPTQSQDAIVNGNIDSFTYKALGGFSIKVEKTKDDIYQLNVIQ